MTLIIERFPYSALTRANIDGQRKYNTPSGAVPSVTTILGKTKDQTHLNEWRNRVGWAKAQEITTEAAGVGTRMHKYLELYIESGEWPSPGSNPYAQQAHRMAEQVRDHALIDITEIWGSEVNLYMPGIYAGTADLVGQYKGNPAILDFKQTNKPKKKEWVEDYYLQLTAYALAHNEIYGTNIREGHVFMCSRDLQYQQFDLWPDEFDTWADRWWTRCEEYYSQFG
jgi:ATP-dependent exoDNAse (exonuclease V) beta subunit